MNKGRTVRINARVMERYEALMNPADSFSANLNSMLELVELERTTIQESD